MRQDSNSRSISSEGFRGDRLQTVFQNLNFVRRKVRCLMCCPAHPLKSSSDSTFSSWRVQAISNLLPPFISRATPIDMEHYCCLPTASILSNKAYKIPSNSVDQQAQVSQGHKPCKKLVRQNVICTEVQGGGCLECARASIQPSKVMCIPGKTLQESRPFAVLYLQEH